ncbi:hypothetical protein V5P93_002983 [Actinokineospora auranticolor]|uniref:Secreted protein n=1 Tax=Actinokineospora auranticolor TaxID=155976 RepID=A0A2S6H124_9PSEU|nr:hypothetical protein [Actinokineospora auranticolor]PPK71120.1 hypothetical protein CLV40_101309 [Actinokineospora auranticolor]
MRGIPALLAGATALAASVVSPQPAAAAVGDFSYYTTAGQVTLIDPPDGSCDPLQDLWLGQIIENNTNSTALLYSVPSCAGSPQVIPPNGWLRTYRPVRAVLFVPS